MYFPVRKIHLFDEPKSPKFAKSFLPIPKGLFCYWLLFGGVYWIGKLKPEQKHVFGNLKMYLFINSGLSSMGKNHTHPQEPGTSSSCYLVTLLWDGIPFFN